MIDELLDLEHQGWAALCSSSGADFYGRTITGDGLMVLAGGEVFDRQRVVDSLNHAPPWRTYDVVDPRVVPLGDDHAVLVYVGHAYREEPEPAFSAVMCSTYRRVDGAWRLALHQQTPLPQP